MPCRQRLNALWLLAVIQTPVGTKQMENALPAVKKTLPIAAWAAAACLTLFTAVYAQNPSGSGCSWQSAFPAHLGIDYGSELAEGQSVDIVEAWVTDADRLQSMGLFGVRQGDRIKMLCIEPDVWRIKHYGTGLAITFSTKPF